MKKIILILFIIASVMVAGCTQKAISGNNNLQTEDISNSVPAQDTGNSNALNIEIRSFAYSPDVIEISKGTTVIWTNYDSVRHTVTSDDGLFDSDLISQGESWSMTFDEAGTYAYHCTPHPNMKGTISVK